MLQTKEILDAALQLPDKDRELLINELAASLHSSFASTEIETPARQSFVIGTRSETRSLPTSVTTLRSRTEFTTRRR
jgi:hypothetical protein